MFFDAIFKPHCMLCSDYSAEAIGLCNPCVESLPWHRQMQCPQCALASDGYICGNCLNAAPDFDATHALFTYNYPIDSVLQQYKYNDMLHLAEVFASLFHAQYSARIDAEIDMVIPMPMHAQRLRERAFNQALEFARNLTRKLQLPLDYNACQRVKCMPPQAGLPLKERVKNVSGVFECSKSLQGMRVAIVDDVMTTGASLNELAKTLKKAGAARVECWVIARTLPK
jgi:ComF family protein